MAQRYFDKFPVITYANTEAIDITRRVAVLDKVASEPYVFYPYEITDNERADQFAARYYDDQYKSWILYVTNKIVDPYYEWYLHEGDMQEFIIKKYGTFYAAQTKIKYYVNNWPGQEDISVSAYNALTLGMQKYWEPIFGSYNRVMSYKRKEVDWKSNTNKIMEYTVSRTNAPFQLDEICNIVFDSDNYGKGQVLSVNENKVTLHHISGVYEISPTVSITGASYIYGTESTVNTAFTDERLVSSNIAEEEEIYWKAVTYLDYEVERNEYNKTIRVLDSRLKQTAVDNLTDLLKE